MLSKHDTFDRLLDNLKIGDTKTFVATSNHEHELVRILQYLKELVRLRRIDFKGEPGISSSAFGGVTKTLRVSFKKLADK